MKIKVLIEVTLEMNWVWVCKNKGKGLYTSTTLTDEAFLMGVLVINIDSVVHG